MSKQLTVDLIVAKTKCDNLLSIKNLNLWGNDIEDLTLLRKMPNLEVLSLSVNRISTLKEFASCSKLQELYLRKNQIQDLSEIRFLTNLTNLRVLWLWDNPCSEVQNYREIVIKAIPGLVKLDNTNISQEERQRSEELVNLEEIFNSCDDYSQEENSEQFYYKQENLGENKLSIQKQSSLYEQPQNQKQQKYYEQQKPNSETNNSQQAKRYSQQQQMAQNEIQKNNLNFVKNENIVSAIICLIKELDETGLEIVKKEVEKKIKENQNNKYSNAY